MKMKTTSVILLLATCLAGFAKDITNAVPEVVPKAAPPGNVEQGTPAPAVTPATEPATAPAAPPEAPGTPAAPTPAVTPEPAAAPAAPTAAPEPASAPAPAAAAQDEKAAGAKETTATTGAAPAVAQGGTNDTVPLIVIEDVPLTDAIRNLARQSNLNFQFDPRVASSNQPTISIRFENVTAQEALQAVLDNYNLTLVRDPKSKIARVTVKDPKAEDPLLSRVVQLKYSDPTNLVILAKSTLSQRSTVVADGRTSQLIITTTEREMDNVVALIKSLDTPNKQVLIEARLYETARNPQSIKGIDWSGTLAAQNVTFGNNSLPGVAPSPTVVTPAGAVIPATPGSLGGILSNPRVLVDTAKGFNPATGFLNADGVSAVISFLNKDSDTEVLSMPRAVTLDNQMATLSVTRAFPVFQVTPGSANSPAGASVQYTNLGTILYVTPRIAADNNIALKIVPEVSNIDSIDRQTLNGTVNTANIYAIRRIETHVMIPSGTTLVMGGMISDSTSKNYVKVPILGDIPGLGLLFRQEGKVRNKSNLLIFITPTVVSEEAFQTTSSGGEFLKTRFVDRPEVKESAWDSGKPHDWSKPVE
ncbi:MAG TPA: secretin N-terminal domain-containing protein [Candidatus Saccharimonadales bacterium]|nr:secretin N-terminal domain-containing protein [Candidatus Saccharimonadales bacterium]